MPDYFTHRTAIVACEFCFRSGTEEEYNQLAQLFEDIWTYRRDMDDLKMKEKEEKSRKELLKREKDRRWELLQSIKCVVSYMLLCVFPIGRDKYKNTTYNPRQEGASWQLLQVLETGRKMKKQIPNVST